MLFLLLGIGANSPLQFQLLTVPLHQARASLSWWCFTGSSGGSGNSVGGRIAPLALCEDTGGSCRMPASANGIYGFRPSLGCYNFTTGMGLVPAEFTRDTVGMPCFHLTQFTHMTKATSTEFTRDTVGLPCFHLTQVTPVTQVIRVTWTELPAASKGLSAPVVHL